MKTSLILTLVIIAVALPYGLFQNRVLAEVKETHRELRASVTDSEMMIKTNERTRSTTSSEEGRERVRILVKKLLFMPQGDPVDEEAKKAGLELVQKLQTISPSLYSFLLNEIRSYSEVGEKEKVGILTAATMMFMETHSEEGLDFFLEARDLLQENPQLDLVFLGIGIKGLSKEDPALAFAWLQRHREDLSLRALTGATTTLFSQSVKTQPDEAFMMLSRMEDTPEMQAKVAKTLGARLESVEEIVSFHEAYQRNLPLLTKSGVDLAGKTFRSFVTALSKHPVNELNDFLTSKNVTSLQKEKIAKKLSGLKLDQRESWIGWIDENSDPSQRTENLSNFIKRWTKEDFQSTARWLNEQDDGPLRELAAQEFAESIAPHEPASAAEWAMTLPEGKSRQELLRKIHSHWEKKDASAAADFAEKHFEVR